jgi:Putative peptidoglycan binding domain
VSVTRTSSAKSALARGLARRLRPRRPGRRLLAALALLLALVGVVVALRNPFANGGSSGSGGYANGSGTSLATVMRQSLSSQTQVDGTLGYAGSSSIVVPAGTAQADLRQAAQTAATARAALRAAQAGLAADEQSLAQARAKLAADRLKLASECGGPGAAASSSGSDSDSGSGSGCSAVAQAVATDEESMSTALQKVIADKGTVASDRATLAGAEQSLAAAESSATGYEAAAAYTMLPSAGTVIRRGKALYAVDGQPVLLLYGRVTAWRAFRSGMSPGRDVAELNANLRALGYGGGLAGDSFTAATRQAIVALQAADKLAQTGVLQLGSVVFKAGPVRVTSVTATLGQAVQAGPVLSVSSTRHAVAVKLDAAQQAQVKVGDPVTITLPDNGTTPGRVSSVGKVASSSGGESDSGPTIDVQVRLAHQAAAGQLVQAPVSVSITTASVKNALVVPVNALLALSGGGGYAIEVVDAAQVHRLVPVTLGLFDDAEGLVQVSGSGVKAGQRVVVPAS